LFGVTWLQFVLFLLSLGMALLTLIIPKSKHLRSLFWILNTYLHWIKPVQLEALDHILTSAKQGDPDSVVAAFDSYCYNKFIMMNLGDIKGVIVDKVIEKLKPKVAVELGSYCGYSTIRFASKLPPGGILHSVDPDPLGHAISAKLLNFSGVVDRVKPWYGFSGDVLKKLAADGMVIDFLFLDHVKELYLPDLQLALSLNLLREGSVVVADNVLFPGAPEYREWIMKHPSFVTEVHTTFAEYTYSIRDELLVSVFVGKNKSK